MASMILYMTSKDADVLRRWINDEPAVAWIVEVARTGNTRTWKAVDRIDRIDAQDYALWHRESGPLNVPSGALEVADATVLDPAKGWAQVATDPSATTPWFGVNLPGPYALRFRERGTESHGSLARSDLSWLADYFRPIGHVSQPAANRWWMRARRFVKQYATAIPWPYPNGLGRNRAYAFPDAHDEILRGRPVDANPS